MNVIKERLDKLVPVNHAPIPIATSYERDEKGTFKWGVYLSVSNAEVGEIDTDAHHEDLYTAIGIAFRALVHELPPSARPH